MFSSKLCHTEDGSHGKYPVKTCCMSDDLFGDMLALSWPNLVFLLDFFLRKFCFHRKNLRIRMILRLKVFVNMILWQGLHNKT